LITPAAHGGDGLLLERERLFAKSTIHLVRFRDSDDGVPLHGGGDVRDLHAQLPESVNRLIAFDGLSVDPTGPLRPVPRATTVARAARVGPYALPEDAVAIEAFNRGVSIETRCDLFTGACLLVPRNACPRENEGADGGVFVARGDL